MCVDLKISEIVDAGQYVVSALLPGGGAHGRSDPADRGDGRRRVLPEDHDPLLDDFVLRSRGAERPRVCFMATAGGDSPDYVTRLLPRVLRPAHCEPSHLALFNRPVADLRAFMLAQDVVYVGGGNTANLLAVWRVTGSTG